MNRREFIRTSTGALLNGSAAAKNLWGREYAKGWEVA